jgi:hypothetical protein
MASQPPLQSAPARNTSMSRNWKWFVPVSIVAAVCLLAGVLVLVVMGATLAVKDTGAYRIAVQCATASPVVQKRLGTPPKLGWFITGNSSSNGPSGSADLNISISGPLGNGRICVAGSERANRWTFETMEVDVEGNPERIPLVEIGEAPAPPPPPGTTPATSNE